MNAIAGPIHILPSGSFEAENAVKAARANFVFHRLGKPTGAFGPTARHLLPVQNDLTGRLRPRFGEQVKLMTGGGQRLEKPLQVKLRSAGG